MLNYEFRLPKSRNKLETVFTKAHDIIKVFTFKREKLSQDMTYGIAVSHEPHYRQSLWLK